MNTYAYKVPGDSVIHSIGGGGGGGRGVLAGDFALITMEWTLLGRSMTNSGRVVTYLYRPRCFWCVPGRGGYDSQCLCGGQFRPKHEIQILA